MPKPGQLTAQIKQHEKEVAKLQRKLAKSRAKLLQLPAKFGFASVAEFVAAVQDAAKGAGAAGPAKGRTRAKITPETKEKVKALVKEGKTGAEIAKVLGISVPSVQNIKKELGLVQKRK